MEDRSLKRKAKPEILTTSSDSSIGGGSNISLYLGAGAFLISVATAILLYREISKIKNSMTDVKHVKNQMMNMDSRFEEMDERLQQVLKSITSSAAPTPAPVPKESFNPIATVVKDIPQEEIEGEDEDESSEDESSDDEISYEEESDEE